jgi:hypothetical protein
MSDVIDLDALQPKPAIIKFKDKEITLLPPTTGDVLRLGEVSQKLQDITKEGDSAKIEASLEVVTQQVYKIVPDLSGEPLNTQQLLVLIKAISDMAIPPDAKELKARGITVDSDPKVA